MKEENKPVNPQAFPGWDMTFQNKPDMYSAGTSQGMTMRDYFAAKAMTVVLETHWQKYRPLWSRIKMIWERGTCTNIRQYHFIDWSYVAKTSYEIADAMLKAREEKL